MEGENVPVLANAITLGDNEIITDPAGAFIAYVENLDLYTIATSNGAVKKAVIEYQAPVAPTTQPPTTQPVTQPPTTQPVTQPVTQPTTAPVDPGTLDLSGSGTANAPYLIQSTADWNKLAAYISKGGNTNDKHFKLTKNITVTTMLGEDDTDFSGSFDGDGHTLTLNLDSDKSYCAPFSRIFGATIRNLKTDGEVKGGIHSSGLVGSINGSEENLIDNCVVAAAITCSAANCGGFVGHGGSMAKTTVRNCVFSGSINNAQTAGTIWGWSDSGSTPVLENCLDVSSSGHPIGRGFPTDVAVTNCYYTNPNKDNTGWRIWKNFGKLAYTVSLSGGSLSFSGTTGIKYDGKHYAAEGEDISLTSSDSGTLYKASAGTLSQKGGSLTLRMPAENVTVSKSDAAVYQNYNNISASHKGFDNEGGECLFDGKTSTKWCVGSATFPMTLNFRTSTYVKPDGVILITANDTENYPERNPVSWKLEASNDGENWTTLIDLSNDHTLGAADVKPYAFSLNSADIAYSFFRFTVNAIADGDVFQLSELQLVGTDTGEVPYTPSDPDEKYDLWLGNTQVTYKNRNDILGDGKASYDPRTNTLTLDKPTISQPYDWNNEKYLIYSGGDLTIKGSFHTGNQFDYGITCIGDLTLDGDFCISAKNLVLDCSKDLIVRSGIVIIESDMFAVSVINDLKFENGVKYFEVNSKYEGLYAGSIELGDYLELTEPEGAYIVKYGDRVTIMDSEGDIVKTFVITQKPIPVSFEMNGHGAAVEAQVLDYGEKASEPKAPTAEGCDFGGWFTDKECTKKYDFNTSVTGAVTLYAKWTVRKYTITFVNDDGTELQKSDIAYGTMPEYKGETPVKKPDAQSYYAFTGWTPAISKVTAEVTYRATFKKNARKLLIGDANGDGRVTIDDVTQIQKFVAELVELTPDQVIAADTNCDGRVTIDDATNIQKYLAEIIDHLG